MKILYMLTAAMLLLSACSRREQLSPESVLDRLSTQHTQTELDKWINENLTKPYGIEVVYRWDDKAQSRQQYVYPPKEEAVLPVLQAFKDIAVGVYAHELVGGEAFFKRLRPYRLYLYGGTHIDANGVERLNNPEAPSLEMSLYDVNNFDPRDKDKVYLLARSIHHQFAYRFADVFPYDKKRFALMNQGRYVPSSANIALGYDPDDRMRFFKLRMYNFNAYTFGFMTTTARLSPEVDFAEHISLNLLHTIKELNEYVEQAKEPEYGDTQEEQEYYNRLAVEAYRALSGKQSFLKEYFTKQVDVPLELLRIISLKNLQDFKPNDATP